MKQLQTKNYDKEIFTNPKPVILEVRAYWSGSSHIMSKIISDIDNKYEDMIDFYYMEYDSETEIIKMLGVNKFDVPCFYFLNKGSFISKQIGLTSKEKVENLILEFLNKIKKQSINQRVV